MKTYWVYAVSNRYRTVLYIGVTNDLARRSAEHASGRGSRFTSFYRAHDLIYAEPFAQIGDAIRREKEIKGWRRAKKLALIRAANPDLHTLLLP